jgi:HSP20 family protein
MRRRLNRSLGGVTETFLGGPFPPANVRSDENRTLVTAEVPGVDSDELDISVENGVLSIAGQRSPETVEEGERYRRHERGHGAFNRKIQLPYAVDSDGVEANYEDGILRIELPREEASKPRKIEVQG